MILPPILKELHTNLRHFLCLLADSNKIEQKLRFKAQGCDGRFADRRPHCADYSHKIAIIYEKCILQCYLEKKDAGIYQNIDTEKKEATTTTTKIMLFKIHTFLE